MQDEIFAEKVSLIDIKNVSFKQKDLLSDLSDKYVDEVFALGNYHYIN